MSRTTLATAALSGFLAAGCAKQGSPGGGAIDQAAPRVVGHRPAADTTGVAVDRPIAIDFSEEMDRERTEEAVFLAPHTDVDLVWSGARLRLEPRAGLAAGRTYVVTVGTEARDLRGNRLESSFSFAFATGARLDSGAVEGRIVDADHGPARGAFVWAYDMARFDGRTALSPPAYVTQTGADGRYRLDRLATGTYRVIAFQDGNRDQKPDAAEAVSLPAGDVAVAADRVAPGGDQFLTTGDAEVRVERATAVDRTHIALVLSRPVDAARLSLEFPGLPVRAIYVAADDPRRVFAVTADQEPGRSYRPRVQLDGRTLAGPEEGVRGSARVDTRAPTVTGTEPAGAVVRADHLVIRFGEAMDTAATPTVTDWVESDSPPAAEGSWRWAGPTRLVFTFARPRPAGVQRLAVRLASVHDLSGRVPADSVAVFAFDVLPEADLCEVSGAARWSAERPVRLALTSATGTVAHAEAAEGGGFRMAGLAPGTYALYAFVDRDGDGQLSAGHLDPYAPSEPYALHGEVRLERGQRVVVDLPPTAPTP